MTLLFCFAVERASQHNQGKSDKCCNAGCQRRRQRYFIDYHNPERYHPLRYLVRMYNRLYHPFVEKLWDRDIDTFAENRMDFVWRKSTYFGRMFQKVVATRKELLVDDKPRTPERPSFLYRSSKTVLLFFQRLQRRDQVCSAA